MGHSPFPARTGEFADVKCVGCGFPVNVGDLGARICDGGAGVDEQGEASRANLPRTAICKHRFYGARRRLGYETFIARNLGDRRSYTSMPVDGGRHGAGSLSAAALARSRGSITRPARTDDRQRLACDGHLRPGMTPEQAADIMWTCSSPELYELLVIHRGWPAGQYGRFAAQAPTAALLPARST